MIEQAQTIAADVAARKRSAVDICRAALQRIERLDSRFHAFLEVTRDYALEQAERVDRTVASGRDPGRLAGVPIAIKDNICTTFSRTTCASKILQSYRSPYAATAVARIEAAGGVVIGKTNLDEFAMGSSTENSAYGVTNNPWDPDCVPGGSSGGSAVSVASGMTPLALGSDTGGSVRQPASLCGVVGFKPTYGRVSRYGLVAYGSSLDQIGPFARSVADAALLLSVIEGHDERDSTSVARPNEDYLGGLRDETVTETLKGLRIGLPKEYFGPGLDPRVRTAIDAAMDVYRRLGARTVEVSLPHSPYCVAIYYLVATAEASSNLARYDGVHYGHRTAQPADLVDLYSSSRNEGFGPEVKRRIMLGTFALSSGYYDAYYTKALKVRRLVQRDFEHAFEKVDVIACPASPTPAFRIGEKTTDPLQMYLADIYTIAANLAGIPGIVIPCGMTGAAASAESAKHQGAVLKNNSVNCESALPIGLQLLGPLFGESLLFRAARAFEREMNWQTAMPPGCE